MATVGSQKKPAARQARHLPVYCSSLSLLFEFLSVPRQAPVSKKPAAKLAAEEAVKVVKKRPATSTTQSGQAPKSSSAETSATSRPSAIRS